MKKLFRHIRESYSGLPKEAWLLSFVIFINRSGTMVIFFMTLYLTQKLEYSVLAAGRMVAVWGFGSVAGTLIGGWLSDAWGTRRVQLLSLWLSGVGFVILGYVQHPVGLAVMLFLQALVADIFRPANTTAIGNACPPDVRPRGFALQRLAANLGIAIGPALGGYFASRSYLTIFWADGLTCLAAGVILWLALRGRPVQNVAEDAPGDTASSSPWKDLVFLSVLGLVLVISTMFFQVFNTWPLFLRQSFGLIESRIGLLLTVNAGLIVLLEMPLVHALDRVNILRSIRLGVFFLFLGFALLPYGGSFAFAVFTVVLWSLGEMLVFPFITTFVAGRATNTNRGRFMGMYTFVFALSFILSPAYGMTMYDAFGPKTLWHLTGLVGVGVWLGFLLIQRRHFADPRKDFRG